MSAAVKPSEPTRKTRDASAPASVLQRPAAPARAFDLAAPSGVWQAAGNLAVQRMMRAGHVQAKLSISQPGDFYEQEADRAADAVMRAPGSATEPPAVSAGRAGPGRLQRKCGCEENPGQEGACGACREKQLSLQRRPAGGASSHIGESGPRVRAALRSGGRPLDGAARAFFEPRFGRDLSGVRVHTGAEAAESARGVNALAYTLGRDIVFGAGQYDAGSEAGRRLLAHELAHVIQQDFGSGLPEAVVQRQPDPQGQPASEPQPEAAADPSVPIPLPPEHDDRVARLEEMAKDIELGERAREELQGQIRDVPIGPPTEEEQTQRDDLRAALTWREENLAAMLEERIALINESLAALQQLLPGVTPAPPKEPNASGVPPPDASVQSEIARLMQEKLRDESRLTLLRRCLARKKIRQISAKLAELPPGPSREVAELEEEKQKQLDFLKTSAAGISCVKPPEQTHHPTEVSPAAFAKMKLGEAFAPTPYVALEGEKTGVGGCTIGFGHVITKLDEGRTCEHAKGPMPEKRTIEPGEKVELGPHLMLIGNRIFRRCNCTPDWVLTKPEAIELAKKDVGVAIKWVKENVHVDLDQGQFDALVDITLAVGSVPRSLLGVIHSKLCVDDEAVRQEYMKTALYTKDNKELGPIHAPRRKERVWAPKGDEDPTCV